MREKRKLLSYLHHKEFQRNEVEREGLGTNENELEDDDDESQKKKLKFQIENNSLSYYKSQQSEAEDVKLCSLC